MKPQNLKVTQESYQEEGGGLEDLRRLREWAAEHGQVSRRGCI